MYGDILKDSIKNYLSSPERIKKKQVYFELPLNKINKLDSIVKEFRDNGFMNVDRNSLIELSLDHIMKQLKQEYGI